MIYSCIAIGPSPLSKQNARDACLIIRQIFNIDFIKMSVSPFSGLKFATPSKRYVDCEISGWMETHRIKAKGKENHPRNSMRPPFPAKSQDVRCFRLKEEQPRQRRVLSKLLRYEAGEVSSRRSKCKTLNVRRFPLKPQSISYTNKTEQKEKGECPTNSWSCKPLTKHVFKIRDNLFKNHLTNKSVQILDRELSTNQRVTVAHIIRSRNIGLLF